MLTDELAQKVGLPDAAARELAVAQHEHENPEGVGGVVEGEQVQQPGEHRPERSGDVPADLLGDLGGAGRLLPERFPRGPRHFLDAGRVHAEQRCNVAEVAGLRPEQIGDLREGRCCPCFARRRSFFRTAFRFRAFSFRAASSAAACSRLASTLASSMASCSFFFVCPFFLSPTAGLCCCACSVRWYARV